MASLFFRGSMIWINYKDGLGKWRSMSTGFRKDNPNEVSQAEQMRDEQSQREASGQIVKASQRLEYQIQKKPYPQYPGVYMLWKDGKISYVGHAKNLRARLAQHALKRDFDHAQFIPVSAESKRLALEALLISYLRPEWNRVIPEVPDLSAIDEPSFSAV
jgi:GIY-YIG catalytic domain